MKYYSASGDDGTTSFGRGVRVSKADEKTAFIGTLDEVQVALGFAVVEARHQKNRYGTVAKNMSLSQDHSEGRVSIVADFEERCEKLEAIEDCLLWLQRLSFELGTLVTETASEDFAASWSWSKQLAEVESACERFAPHEQLKAFVLPGGSELAARIELARVAVRRAERAYCGIDDGAAALPLLNRLSSLCFVLARYSNEALAVRETTL